MVEKWDEFEWWQALYKDRQRSLEGLLSSEPLTENSIFIWCEISPPKKKDAKNGKWDVYPKPLALAGFLRYVGLPAYFDVWLVREEWDREPAAFRHPDELLTMADSVSGSRFKDMIPVMQEIYCKLDNLFDLPDEQVRKGLRQVADLFNENWSETGSWHFKIQTFDTPAQVGERVFTLQKTSDHPFEMSKRQWMDLCNSVVKDFQSQAQFLKILSENSWF
ncbi:MAG: hypothetical protein PHP23_00240 [Desulfobacterales bacterium]|nr:hypothetical protein [Desulfobacterales bacterium]MDD4073416.1 hypothetical protein [Desulfobacterales bacterium]MDD4391578.1 hypothetical protein [Desulfobacterales bacterium]